MKDNKNINAMLLILFIFRSSIALPINQLTESGIGTWSLFFITIIVSIVINKGYIRLEYIVITMISIIFFIFNMTFVSYKHEIIYIMGEFVINGLITLYFAIQDIDYNKMLRYWYILGSISFINWVYILLSTPSNNINYMALGVCLVYCFIIYSYYYYFSKRFKILNLILVLITFMLIFIEGNRSSSIICVFIIVYYQIVKIKEENQIWGLLRIGMILSISYILIYNVEEILIYIQNELIKRGMYSYSITKFNSMMTGSIDDLFLGRTELYDAAINIVYSSNFMPRGVGYFEYITGFVYPHNVLLELFITFGVLSIPIIILFLFYFTKKVKIIEDKILVHIIFILIIFSITRLSFSSMFWNDIPLWVCIGFLINQNRKKIIVKF